MNVKTWAPLGVAAVLGLAAWMLGRDGGPKVAPASQGPKLRELVVAKGDVPAGATLKVSDLGTTRLPDGQLPAGVFGAAADAADRVLTVPVVKGQTILESMLAPRNSAAGLPALVPDGMRAVTMEVNEFSGVAGLLAPHCRVDVVATLNGEDNLKTAARTLAANIEVIAVGRRLIAGGPDDPNAGPAHSITLLVSPREAEVVELACHLGNPRLVLRGSRDTDGVRGQGVTVAELRNLGPTTQPTESPWLAMLTKLLGGGAGPAPAVAPTTAPSVAEAAPAGPTGPTTKPADAKQYREVTVIRSGVESVQRIEVRPAKPAPGVGRGEGSALAGQADQLKPVPDGEH